MTTSRKIGLVLNTVMDDVQKLEARASAAEREVIRLMDEKSAFYDARSRVLSALYDARTEYVPSMMCTHIEIRPTNHSFRFTDDILTSSHAPLPIIADYVDKLLEAHVRHLRPQLEEGAWRAARQAAHNPRAYAYR